MSGRAGQYGGTGTLATPAQSRAFVLHTGKAAVTQLFISGLIDQPMVAAFVSQCPVTYFGYFFLSSTAQKLTKKFRRGQQRSFLIQGPAQPRGRVTQFPQSAHTLVRRETSVVAFNLF